MRNFISKICFLVVIMMVPMVFMGQNKMRSSKFTYEDWNQKPIETALILSLDGGTSVITGGADENNIGFSIHPAIGYGTKFWGVKFRCGYEQLSGSSTERNQSFKANFIDTSIQFHLNAIDLFAGKRPHRFNVCPHVGLGIIHQKTKLYGANGDLVYMWGYNSNQIQKEDRGGFIGRKIFSMQFGAEANFLITPEFYVFIDYSMRYVDTKWLDGMPLKDRKDWVSTINVGLAYKVDLNKKKSRNNTGYFRSRR